MEFEQLSYRAFGGVEGILEHTLFKGTYFPTWEGLFWLVLTIDRMCHLMSCDALQGEGQ